MRVLEIPIEITEKKMVSIFLVQNYASRLVNPPNIETYQELQLDSRFSFQGFKRLAKLGNAAVIKMYYLNTWN